MKSDVVRHIRQCRRCLQNKPEQTRIQGLMSYYPKVTQPWQMWSIGIVGALPRSKSRNIFVLVVCDCFSKFPLFFPLQKTLARDVVSLVANQVILFFGAPQFMLCNNELQFKTCEFQDLAIRWESTIIFNPVYHPQSNPAERVNRILKTMLRSYVGQDHRTWDRIFAIPAQFCVFWTTYDLQRRPREFAPGDLVWRKNYILSEASVGFICKLAPEYLGLFKIPCKVGYCTYELQDDGGSSKRTWHVKDIKPHVEDQYLEEISSIFLGGKRRV